MASILYREHEGRVEEIRVEYDQFEAMLSAGWSATLPGEEQEKAELADDEVREAAKEAGIEGWDTKRIATLRKALELK